jgi:hypothetical protein
VNNSGRLAALMREATADDTVPWSVQLSVHADRDLIAAGQSARQVIASADRVILDAVRAHVDIAQAAGARLPQPPWRIDLAGHATAGD